MTADDILILNAKDVGSLLAGRELDIIRTVRLAYEAHSKGHSALPHSTFLRFPDSELNRIIALPAYLGDEFDVAGVKWVSSFPGNAQSGLDRASAVIVLNSVENGRPEVILEGSIISAKRTAASAALAAQVIAGDDKPTHLGMIGLGPINLQIVRFLMAAVPGLSSFKAFDLDSNRGRQFAKACKREFGIEVALAPHVEAVLEQSEIVSLATTAGKPHIFDCSMCSPGTLLLHISLRDLSPKLILKSDNVVDDVDHVCRAQTSVHLAEQSIGNRSFVRCTLADILAGSAPKRRDSHSLVVFSPFGLGILDLAVSGMVRKLGAELGLGTTIRSFLPAPWLAD